MEFENNYLKEEIEKILDLCYDAVATYGRGSCYFGDGMDEKVLSRWEADNNITIPYTYKEWLRFAGQCVLLFDLAVLVSPRINYEATGSSDLVLIGRIIGDEEILCFSKSRQSIVRVMNGVQKEYKDFKVFLNQVVIRLIKGSIAEDEDILQDENANLFNIRDCESIKVKTSLFNKMAVEHRCQYLDYLKSVSERDYDNFMDDIRRQAMLDFWYHERELIKNGQCTKDWNPNQIENIMNINIDTGMCEVQAGRP